MMITWAGSLENLSLGISTRSDTNWALKPQMVRSLKFLCSQNKGTDQLHGNHAADLRLCFCIYMQKPGFLMMWLKLLILKN